MKAMKEKGNMRLFMQFRNIPNTSLFGFTITGNKSLGFIFLSFENKVEKH